MTASALPSYFTALIKLGGAMSPKDGPSVRSRGTELEHIGRLSQAEVAAKLCIAPQAAQATERRALSKIKLAIMREPDVVEQYDPEFARRHHLVPRCGHSLLTFGGHYMNEAQREELHGWRRRARQWETAAKECTRLGLEEDAAACKEAADGIRQEIATLEQKLRTVPHS